MDTKLPTRDQVWIALAKTLGKSPEASYWDLLENDGYVDNACQGDVYPQAFADLVDRYRDLESVLGKSVTARENQPSAVTTRNNGVEAATSVHELAEFDVLSGIIALVASEHPGVALFRSRYLNEKPLARSEIGDWLTRMASSEDPPTRWVNVPLDNAGNVDVEWFKKASPLLLPTASRLGYLHGESLQYGYMDINGFGTLDVLREFAWHLAINFCWSQAAAVTFVLCDDITPAIRPWLVNPRRDGTRVSVDTTLASLATARFEFNLSISPKQVADVFQQVRESQAHTPFRPWALDANRLSRRRLSKKHMQLASLAKWNLATSNPRSWAELLDWWNRECNGKRSDWQYRYPEQFGNFIRDAKTAFEKVIGATHQEFLDWLSRITVTVDGGEKIRHPLCS